LSVNQGLDLGNWRDINEDFDRNDNKKEINLFETEILKRIKETLEKKKKSS
jgi:hypothetical protein